MAKQWFGLDESIHLNEGNLVEDLNSKESRLLNQDLIEKITYSITKHRRFIASKAFRHPQFSCGMYW